VSRKAPPVNENANSAVRTLILGMDRAGRIVQSDRTAPKILACPSGDLLGVHLNEILSQANGISGSALRSPEKDPVKSLIETIKSGREGNAVLSTTLEDGSSADAVVSVRPLQTDDGPLAAFVILQIPVPNAKRFQDPSLTRDVLLRETFNGLSNDDTLDFGDLAEKFLGKLVPHFCTAGDVSVLESLVGDNEYPEHGPDASNPLRRLAVAHDSLDPAWHAAFPAGEILRYPDNSPYVRCIESGEAVLEQAFTPEAARKLARAWRRKPVGRLLADSSMLVLPLVAKGAILGFFCCVRGPGYRRFDAYDVQIGMDFAARAAVFFDNARRFKSEHATALTLQRAMLPTGLSSPSSVEVGHRYLPGSALEVGGDWYESIKLPGARVALVVGDVAGHGVRAAVTMGRLRTAIQTLSMLELPPAESLQQLDVLMQGMGEREPHFATCAYAVYDAVCGELELAIAGHLPPLLIRPDRSSDLLEVTPSPPLGASDISFDGQTDIETQRFPVQDGSLLVLYTDGLVESKDRDITDGMDRLKQAFATVSPDADLEDLCKTSLDGVYADAQRDDIAVLIAKLRRIPEENRCLWHLDCEETSVRQARHLLRDPLKRWDLEDLLPVTELLVSELVTNAIRYAKGDIELRVIHEPESVVCEVHDTSPALPRVLQVDKDAENGRGLHVVAQLATRWGARRNHTGKVVWCEQAIPEVVRDEIDELANTPVEVVPEPAPAVTPAPAPAKAPARTRAARRPSSGTRSSATGSAAPGSPATKRGTAK
jgi:serine phosphatase RsbU (regulator of sigma subunit)/anti-sigma regulatory factor (Ser/Thr protein kinase)